MHSIRKRAIRAGLETLYYSGAHRLARPLCGGVGAILAFHRVRPPRSDPFQPNRHLEIAPEFLAAALRKLRAGGIEIVSIDEAHRRLVDGDFRRRFAVLTFDDGYRDTFTHAWPILRQSRVPFTLYAASAFADGEGMLWWAALEAAIAKCGVVYATFDGKKRAYDCSTLAAKGASWQTLYRRLSDEIDETRMRMTVREIVAQAGINLGDQCREICMGWNELKQLAGDELVTIGAHTIRHPVLARLRAHEARSEMEGGARRIEARLGVGPVHLAYPVGNAAAAGEREFALAAEAGFKTAVTTRPGVLLPDHAGTPLALPRLSVNGDFQRLRYLDVLLSGTATALWNGFRLRAA
jgi:peptidoglycan/xylan/chitin deacetylase (PgdA/CDA1 family)